MPYILALAQPKGYLIAVKCEKPFDELTLQDLVALLLNLKYCTLCKVESQNYKQTD